MATMPNTNINIPYSAFLDPSTGRPSQVWLLWLMNPTFINLNVSNAISVTSGGTGLTTIPSNGQLLIGNGTGYTLNTLNSGAGISVINGSGTITIANTGVLSNIAGTGISVSGATGNVTITNNGVLSFSGGATGLTPSTATAGAVTLDGTLAIANGGTNGTSVPTAGAVPYGTGTAYAFSAAGVSGQVLTSAGAGTPTWGAVSLTSQVSGILPVANGGTGVGVAYTVATLPTAGTQGRRAWVTNALAPAFGAAPVGGGAVVIPVFDNGTAWIVG